MNSAKLVTVLRKLGVTDTLAEVIGADGKVLAASRAQSESQARREAQENFENFLLREQEE